MAKKKDKNLKELEKEIKELKERNEELENNWKRAVADLQNYKKRYEKERTEFVKFANERLLQELLPVFDNLEMVQEHLDDTGFKVTINQFRDTLKRLGVKEVDCGGKKFDPNICEAVETVEGESNKVVEVVQKGYYYNDKILRPARVKVGKKKD